MKSTLTHKKVATIATCKIIKNYRVKNLTLSATRKWSGGEQVAAPAVAPTRSGWQYGRKEVGSNTWTWGIGIKEVDGCGEEVAGREHGSEILMVAGEGVADGGGAAWSLGSRQARGLAVFVEIIID